MEDRLSIELSMGSADDVTTYNSQSPQSKSSLWRREDPSQMIVIVSVEGCSLIEVD